MKHHLRSAAAKGKGVLLAGRHSGVGLQKFGLSQDSLPSPSQWGSVATSPISPSALLPASHMTEKPVEQLGLEILVSRAIVCPLSPSPVCPAATSTDSQHQLIIATVAVKETHFGSDRLMTCKTCSY